MPHDTAEAATADAGLHLERGEPLLAYNAAQTGLQKWPDHARLRQLQALALARSGDIERANTILDKLAGEGMHDAETLGMLARTHKDLALTATGAARRAAHLEAGFRLYERAYRSARSEDAAAASYTGINAATMAVLMGDLDRARAIATDVREMCQRIDGDHDRYWKEATLGEAALILGDARSAAAHYAGAARLAKRRYGDVSTTRRQARLLAAHLPGVEGDVTAALKIPPVLVFTGHMIDRPDRPDSRFPALREGAVRDAIRERLGAIAPLAVYGSAACGADILCLELARELGIETHVVLPFPPAEFCPVSVDFAPGDWRARFDRVLTAADSVTITSDHHARGSAATFEYANLVLTGMGRLRSQMLDTTVRGLAVWDPRAAAQVGGAAALVSVWRARGLAADHIHLPELRDLGVPPPPAPPASDASLTSGVRHEIRALLFADAVGYSQLSEDQIPSYISGFLGAVADLNRRTSHRFEHVETAGDGLYMVFGSAADAGNYALQLSALANGFDWTACGLPSTFNLRIALHSGPVHCGHDPITDSPIYTGPHTSRTARIEPITPPGQVYASGAFAAVAAASGAALTMNYVGRMPLAKGYGTLALYHVRGAG